MASEFWYVFTHKNKYEKEERKQRNLEIENLKEDGLFRVALNNQLDIIKNIFEDENIQSVEVEVDDNSLVLFGRAFGYEEMQSYLIAQKPGATNVFIISKKEVSLY